MDIRPYILTLFALIILDLSVHGQDTFLKDRQIIKLPTLPYEQVPPAPRVKPKINEPEVPVLSIPIDSLEHYFENDETIRDIREQIKNHGNNLTMVKIDYRTLSPGVFNMVVNSLFNDYQTYEFWGPGYFTSGIRGGPPSSGGLSISIAFDAEDVARTLFWPSHRFRKHNRKHAGIWRYGNGFLNLY